MKNVKIEDVAFVVIKEYCNRNGLKIYSWVTKILLEKIKSVETQLEKTKDNRNISNKK